MTSSARSSIAPEASPAAASRSRAIAPSVRPAASIRCPSSCSSPWTCDQRGAQRVGVLARRALEQRPVDVPEQQERRGHRLNDTPGSSRCAKAAISFAALCTSSSWTISTGECM